MNTAMELARLQRPRGLVDVVLDTDAYNEIDDQFAIAYLLHAPERARVLAINAAPFFNDHSTGPRDGMEKSYDEIHKLLRLMGRDGVPVYRGSTDYLADETTPRDSDAARNLARLADQYSPEKPLYVLAIGAITNVASALLRNPQAAKNLVIVWLGGHGLHWPHSNEFNLRQDVAAGRVVMDSQAALVLLPCMGVVEQMRTTGPELIHWLRGKNALCDYLCDNTIAEAESYAKGKSWSRVIWDVSVVAWLLDTDKQWLEDYLCPKPVPEYDHHWGQDPTRPLMCYVYHIQRDAVFYDLFTRLTHSHPGEVHP